MSVHHIETPAGSIAPRRFMISPDKWVPAKNPELSTYGFPFSPSFIIHSSTNNSNATHSPRGRQPFGFHFRRWKGTTGQLIVNLAQGDYDPVTQVYTPTFQPPGETEGGEFDSSQWTYDDSKREWDPLKDYETD